MWQLSSNLGMIVSVSLIFSAVLVLPATSFGKDRVTLVDLENYIQKYAGLSDLLSDPEGLQEYRELVKSYMGYAEDFDPIFEATINQMKILSLEVPGFSERLWTLSAEQGIEIEGSRSQRSGIELNARLAAETLEKARATYRGRVEHLLLLSGQEKSLELERLEKELSKHLEDLSKEYPSLATKRDLTRSENRLLHRDEELRRQRQEYFHRKRELLESSEFLTYLRYELSGAEIWLDIYRQDFAESSIEAVTRLSRLDGTMSNWVTTRLGRELSPQIKEALQTHSGPWLQELQTQLERVLKAKREVNALVTPREPPELMAEMAQIQQQNPGVQPQQALERLSENGRKLAQEFANKRSEIYRQKIAIVRRAEAGSAFRLPLVDEQDKLNLEVRRQTSDAFVLIPIRGIHSVFGGLLVKECVGGACVENLTPRRWALAALEGSRVFAAEKGGEFDGILRLVPTTVSIEQEGSEKSVQSYENVDMMIRSISDTTEIQSEVTGETAKYSLFDAILDRIQPHDSSSGFLAGNGHAISQNTGLAKVYQRSPSVLQAELIEAKHTIGVQDQEMETAINSHFPLSPHGYNPGGMIYEGMPGDGNKLFVLRSRSQRVRLTQEDLEAMIMKDVLLEKNPLESAAWALAVENDIKLPKRLDYYTEFESSAVYRALDELRSNSDARPERFLLDKLKKHPSLAVKFPDIITSLIREGDLHEIGAIFNSRPQLIVDLPDQWEELRLKLFEFIRSDDFVFFEELEELLLRNPLLSERLPEHLILILHFEGREIKAIDALGVLARIFASKPDLIEKLEPVWKDFVNKTDEVLNSADLETLDHLANFFLDHQPLIERLGPLWLKLDQKIAESIPLNRSDSQRFSVLLFDFSDRRPDKLPSTLMALIETGDQDFLEFLSEKFLDTEVSLAERMPDHYEAFLEANAVVAREHFGSMLEDLGYRDDTLDRLVRSNKTAVLDALSASFASNLEAAEIFWEDLIERLHEPDSRRSLVALFRHPGLREVFAPFLKRTPEAELFPELLELAQQEGHRGARVRLTEISDSELDSESPSLEASSSSAKGCRRLLLQLHLKILAP